MLNSILRKLYRFVLRRKLFKGQFRLFMWIYNKQQLSPYRTTTKPLAGSFTLEVDTKNFIDACIYYTGDYEPYLKSQFRQLIRPGDCVLDIGANIGFHTLYFAELVGHKGRVFAFEPILVNYQALIMNLSFNTFKHIQTEQIALGNESKTIHIHVDPSIRNPGSYTLLTHGKANTYIHCLKGDDYVDNKKIGNVNFIKIDVEGYEHEVLKGLKETIINSRPIINFEYDRNYQLKMNDTPADIFSFFDELNYKLYEVDGYGERVEFIYKETTKGAEIIAFPN